MDLKEQILVALGLKKEEQESFILQTKNLLTNSTLVRFKETNSQEPNN